MYVLSSEKLTYKGKRTGVTITYRPVPRCFKMAVQDIVTSEAGRILQSGGDESQLQQRAGAVVIQRRGELMLLLLRLCLRDLDVMTEDGKLKLDIVPEQVGGLTTTALTEAQASILLDGDPDLAEDLADFTEYLEANSNLSDRDKKKSGGDLSDPQVGGDEVPELQGGMSEMAGADPVVDNTSNV